MSSINFSAGVKSAVNANNKGANFMLDLAIKTKTAKTEKAIKAQEEQLVNLNLFIDNMDLKMFPTPSQIILVKINNDKPNVSRNVMNALVELGVEFIGIKKKMHMNNTIKSEGADLKLFGSISTTPFDKTIHGDALKSGDVPVVSLTELSTYFAKFLAKQMEAWLPTDFAKLVNLLFPKTKVDSDTASVVTFAGTGFANSECYIDFTKLEVKMGRQVRKANAQIQIGSDVMDTRFALFVLATMLGNAGNPSSLKDAVNKLTSLWVRSEDYGIKFSTSETAKNDATHIVHNNLCLPLAMTCGRKGDWPWLALHNDSFDVSSLQTIMDREGVVAIDKYGMKWVSLRRGAEAMMLGRLGDMILNPHDASKPAKFFNRPTQAFKFTKADSNDRVQSKLRVALSDGTFSVPGGIMLHTAFTNSRLAMGSGIGILNPSKSISYYVDKTVRGEVNILRLPSQLRQGMMASKEPMQKLVDSLTKVIKATVVGKTFLPGETILALDGGNHVIITNDYDNQPLLATKDFTVEAAGDVVKIQLKVRIEGNDQCVKLRGMGVKLTTLPYEVSGFSSNWDLMLNIETAKGKIGLVHLFVNANGGGVYNPNEGTIVLDKDGQVIDLKEKVNGFTEWVATNTREEYIRLAIAKAEWQIIAQCFPNADDIKVIESHKDYVVVEEKIQVVFGGIPYDVEVSTPRENTGTSGLTLEQLANLSLQNRSLAEILHKESAEYKHVVCNLVGLVAGEPELPEVDTYSSAGRQAFRDAVTTALAGKELGRKDRDILVAVAKAYPGGLALVAKSETGAAPVTLRIHTPVIAKMGAFLGGSASDVAGVTVAVLSFLLDEKIEEETGINTRIYSWIAAASSSLEGWMDKMTKSGGVLKRLGRTKKLLVNGKVKTSYHPMLQPGTDGLPVAILHPECAIVRILGVKNGDIIGGGRTPMPFVTCFKVKLSREVGQVAHVMILPSIWAAGNEGDSDGDGIFTLNLTKRGVTVEAALEMNAHVLGQAGYAVVYGASPSNWPYADFVSYEDKWGKKALTSTKSAIIFQMPAQDYVHNASLVEGHYRMAVGTAYGICSALSFYTANMAYEGATEAELDRAVRATTLAWRVLYEGLGLAGYSPEAKDFFEVLSIAVWSEGYTFNKDGKREFARDSKVEGYKPCAIELAAALVKATGLDMETALDLLDLILSANKVRATIGRLERGGKKLHPALPEEGALFGALRRLGQGRYGVDAVEEAMETEENGVASTFRLVEEMDLAKNLSAPFLRETLTTAVIVHRTLADKMVDDEQNDALGDF